MVETLNPKADARETRADAEPLAEGEESLSLSHEFFIFLREHRKWWLAPIIILIVAIGLILFIGACTPLSPFIYSLF